MKNTLHKIKCILINKKPPKHYEEKSKRLFNEKNYYGALKTLRKGLNFYPNSLLINRQFAIYYTNERILDKAEEHWEKVFQSPRKKLLRYKDYETAVFVYEELLKIEKAIKVCRAGLKKYRYDERFILSLSNMLLQQKRYTEVIELLGNLIVGNKSLPTTVYLNLAHALKKSNFIDKSEHVLRLGLLEDQSSVDLLNEYINIAIDKKQWRSAITRIRYYFFIKQPSFNMLIRLSMLYQLIGEEKEANQIFNKVLTEFSSECKNDAKGYRKITLFKTADTRIDFYKKLAKVEKVIVSFDSLYMNWNETPFGFKLLRKQQLDIIAVRKRKKGSSQQDLKREEFESAVSILVKNYKDKIAYGHSLGGYTSLYYTSGINCRILALSPRLSIHPKYGKEKKKNRGFKHDLTHPYNDKIEPIIVYDPKDKIDHRYVNDELLKCFPNAILIKMPYAGHGIARHLLRMGKLKEYILKVIDGELPKYDKKLKAQSVNYCRRLGSECLKRNKLSWADHLSEKSVNLHPEDHHSINLRANVLKRLNKYEEAKGCLESFLKSKPKNLRIRLALIDLYIEKGDLFKAEQEVYKIKDIKEKSRRMMDEKFQLIEATRKRILETPLHFMESEKR